MGTKTQKNHGEEPKSLKSKTKPTKNEYENKIYPFFLLFNHIRLKLNMQFSRLDDFKWNE
jgi:hypothetical protein